MTDSDPHGHHNWTSPAYVEAWIANDVTHDADRQPVLRRMVQLLPIGHDDPVRVLDVGGGYGMLTREVLEELPRSVVWLEDLSEAMIAQARLRLAEFAGRVNFVSADLRDPAWVHRLDGPFDAVVSSIAIHNVRDPSLIRRIYFDVAGLVKCGGCFFNLDFVAPDDAPAQEPGTTVPAHTGEPGPATLDRQMAWLSAAGFARVECPLRYGHQVLLAAYGAP